MSLERGQELVRKGTKTGFEWYKKLNLARFKNLESARMAPRPLYTSFLPFFPVLPLSSLVFHDFGQKQKKWVSRFGGTRKERKGKRSFPFVSYSHFLPFLSRHTSIVRYVHPTMMNGMSIVVSPSALIHRINALTNERMRDTVCGQAAIGMLQDRLSTGTQA